MITSRVRSRLCRTAALVLVAGALAIGAVRADSTTTTSRSVTRLADGVYEIRHPDAPDGFPQGNTTVVIGDRGALVVDSCLLPASAREDIAQIRRWTSKPVLYLVNTHWHFDHTLGNAAYREAFPDVRIVAQATTRKTIADFNPGAVARYPQRAERFKKVLASGRGPDGQPLTEADRRDYEHALAGLAPTIEQMKGAVQLVPDVGFDAALDVDLGSRPVQIRFLGRGNTAGDTVVFLPGERIVAAGDLLDHPVPYFFGGFPVECIDTLRALERLGPETIVPGHGDVLQGTGYIDQVVALLEAVKDEIAKEINDGLSLEEVRKAAPVALDQAAWRKRFAGDDPGDGDFFDGSFAKLVENVFNEVHAR